MTTKTTPTKLAPANLSKSTASLTTGTNALRAPVTAVRPDEIAGVIKTRATAGAAGGRATQAKKKPAKKAAKKRAQRKGVDLW